MMSGNYATTKIASGDTVEFRQMRDELWKMIEETTIRFDSEELLVGKENKEDWEEYEKDLNGMFNEWLGKLRVFPKYKYLINFLFSYFPPKFEKAGSAREQLFTELEAMEKDASISLSDGAQECLDDLVESLLEEFEEQGPAKKYLEKYTAEYLKENIIHFSEEFLFEFLAPVLALTVEEVDVFLTRVLRRPSLDYYEAKEFLLYIALESNAALSVFNVYRMLLDTYENLPTTVAKTKKTVPEGTIFVKNMAEEKLADLGNNVVINVKGEVDASMVDLMKWHKALNLPAKRTAENEFERLYEEVRELYTDSVKDYNLLFKHELSVKERRANMLVVLQVEYEEGKSVVLPAGTQIRGEKNVFELTKDWTLPACNKAREKIRVASLTEIENYAGASYLPSSVSLRVKDDGVRTAYGISSITTFEKGETYNKERLSKPSFVKGKDSGRGSVWVEWDFGVEIPEGTVFVYEDATGIYEFATKESVIKDYPTGEVEAFLVKGAEPNPVALSNKSQPYHTLENKHKINYMDPVEGVVSVTNPYKVTYEENIINNSTNKGEDEDNEGIAELVIVYDPSRDILFERDAQFYNRREDGSIINVFKLIQDYILPEKDIPPVKIEVRACTEMPSDVTENKFMKKHEKLELEKGQEIPGFVSARISDKAKPRCYASEETGKLIEVKGEAGCRIPAGTKFYFENGKEQLEFVTMEEKVVSKYVTSDPVKARCVPINDEIEIVQKRANTGENVYAFPNTITSMNKKDQPDGFISVTNPNAASVKTKKKAVSADEFIAYLYSLKDLMNQDTILDDLDGEVHIDVDNLKSEWFLNTIIPKDAAAEFANLSNARKRSLMLTLIFLKFVKIKEQEEIQGKAEENDWEISPMELEDEFSQSVDIIMNVCRMNEFDMGNPLDAFFNYLLLDSYPYDTLRILYKML